MRSEFLHSNLFLFDHGLKKSIHTFWLFLRKLLAYILGKSCSKWDLFGGFGSGETNALITFINEQNDIDKIYLCARDLREPKYEYLIKKREDAGINHVNNPNAYIECSNTVDGVYKNINDYNPIRKRKKLIVFDYMIEAIMGNKKFQAIIKKIVY